MSGKRFQARAKTVQKLGRDGLMEQNKATGEEKRVSGRTADISFGPDRPQEQAAGHRAAMRGGDPAPPGKKKRKQPRPVRQTAEEAVWASTPSVPEPYSVPEVPDVPEPAAPSMRMAADAPMLAVPAGTEEPPPTPPVSRRRRKRKNRKKSKQRQAARHTPNAARSLETLPETASMRGKGDAPMQNRPPGAGTERGSSAKRLAQLMEGGGRLKFEPEQGETTAVSDAESTKESKSKMKKRQVQRFSKDAAKPETTVKQHPARLRDDGGGRLRFEGAADSVAQVPDAEPSVEARRAVKKHQVMEYAANATEREDAEQEAVSATVNDRNPDQSPTIFRETDNRARDSPQPLTGLQEPTVIPADWAAYQRRQSVKYAAHSAAAQSEKPRLQFEDAPPPPKADNAPTPAPASENATPPSPQYDKAVRRVERAEQKVEQAQAALPTKRRLTVRQELDAETAKSRRRLRFEEEVLPEYRPPSLPARAGGMAKTAAVMKVHGKIHESERENVAVEATHKSELVAERGAGRLLRWEKNRLRSKPYRALRQAEQQAAKENLNLAWQTALRDNPELQKKHALAKWVQKQQIKRKYAQAAHEAKQTAQFTQNVVNSTGQIVRAVAQQVAARKSVLAIVALLALVAVFFSAGLTSCTAMLSAFQSSYISASYLANEQDICNADLYFTELETDLQMDIDSTEINYPGYDGYRYSIPEISHNPYELMAYLSTAFNAFTFDEVQAEILRLFGEKYQLTRTEIVEGGNRILQTTLTVRPLREIIDASLTPGEQTDRYETYMQTLGNRQAYGNPFDFPWLSSVSSGYGYRVHPITGEKNLHRGVDIAAAPGTPIKAVQDGRVVSAGDAGGYGLCVVIEDDKGYQSRYAHCSSLSVSAGQEVKRGDVIAAVGSTGQSTGPHLHLEVMLNGEYLNPYYFVDTGDDGTGSAAPGTPGGPVIPDDPGTPMGDGSFAAMLAEAEKYLGFPYVWGGSSPSTSFDCSGFVSWVINQSGVGSVGRQTVLGLQSLSTPVSAANVQPGDLVFFIGTYDAPRPGPTHIGIYVGNGRFIHCGSSGVSYGSVSSSYWSSHLYGYARLN